MKCKECELWEKVSGVDSPEELSIRLRNIELELKEIKVFVELL